MGGLVVSFYLIFKSKKIDFKYYLKGYGCFLVFETIALIMNILVYKSNILGDRTFNMFYISPYFISSLPGFDYIQMHVPYIIFLFIYNLIIFTGGYIIYIITRKIKK